MNSTPFWGPDFDQLTEEDPEIASIVLSELDLPEQPRLLYPGNAPPRRLRPRRRLHRQRGVLDGAVHRQAHLLQGGGVEDRAQHLGAGGEPLAIDKDRGGGAHGESGG